MALGRMAIAPAFPGPALAEHLVQRGAINRINQLRMELAQRLHHHARIDFEHLPASSDADDIDGGKTDIDRLCGLDCNGDGGLAGLALLEKNRARAKFEIMAPVLVALLAVDRERIPIEQDHTNFVVDVEVWRDRETHVRAKDLQDGKLECRCGRDPKYRSARRALIRLDDETLWSLLQQRKHRPPRPRCGG